MTMWEARDWARRYLISGYTVEEVISIIDVHSDFDEYQLEDLEHIVRRVHETV